jgi:hypothetical protein
MNTDPIRYVTIWSGWLRAAHWLIAIGVLFELFSASKTRNRSNLPDGGLAPRSAWRRATR